MAERPPPSAPPRDPDPGEERALDLRRVLPDVLAVRGELDLATAPLLLAAVADPGARRIDLSGVTFIDVAGLRAVASTGLPVVGMSRQVARLASVCAASGWSELRLD